MRIDFNGKLPVEANLNALKKVQDLDFAIDNETALFIVDMNNGFVRKGALASDRAESIVPDIVKMIDICIDRGAKIVAFTDCHTEDSPEFKIYPKHCIAGTEEVELIDEIKAYEDRLTLIPKNSTNAYVEEATQKQIADFIINRGIKKWVIVGVCSDICIQAFSLSLKTHLISLNIDNDVVVPLSGIETYDAPGHDANFMNVHSLFNMMVNGIKIVGSIK